MEYVDIGESSKVACQKNGGQYTYSFIDGDDEYSLIHRKSPLEHTKNSNIGKELYGLVSREQVMASSDSERNMIYLRNFNKILQKLQDILDSQSIQDEVKAKQELEQSRENYEMYYTQFQMNCRKYDYTPLQYLVRIFESFGVNSTLEIFKAYLGYLQTLIGVKGTNVIAIGGQSSGKALALDTLIPTPTGYTTMRDIQIGDELFDNQGNICHVMTKSEIFYGHDCYKITFDNDTIIVADANHRWYVQDKKQRDAKKYKHSILTTEEMFDRLTYIENNWKHPNTFSYSIDSCRKLKLGEIDLPIDPYLLGLWLGDGDSNASYFTTVDLELLDAFRDAGYNISNHKSDKNRYGITGGFWKLLRINNLLNNKHIPKEYLRASHNQRLSLIQGIMDTDGSIDKNGKCEITLKNYELIHGLKELLFTIGIKCKINETWKYASNTENKIKRKYYRLFFTTNQPVFRLKRKFERLPKPSKRYYTRHIKSIEKIDSVPTQCISVDSKSHLFLVTDEFIPTHNTHILENPLDCIPNEYVHRGIYTKPAFFTKFAGHDLTHHIFYMGDLGGANDDSATIEFRDTIKPLSTDGYAHREYKVDNEPVEETIRGYPALAYTTVNEEMINDQERSRSVILMPPDVDKWLLMIYDSFLEAPASDFELKQEIEKSKNLVKGYSWFLLNNFQNIEMYNPYMFAVQDYLQNIDDFNRKIKEFNGLLKLVIVLNGGFQLNHTMYYDEDEEPIDTTVVIASKKDVIDALNLFEGSSGLLPTEVALVKGLLDNYTCYNDAEELYYDEDLEVSFEEYALDYNKVDSNDKKVGEDAVDLVYVEEETDKGKKYFIKNWDKAYTMFDSENNESEVYVWFTVPKIKEVFKNKRWYRNVKDKLSEKLLKLHEYGMLIKMGKTESGANVYGLNYGIEGYINNIEPKWSPSSIKAGVEEFHRKYPTLSDEFDEFISKDRKLNIKYTDMEIDDGGLYDLPWRRK